MTQLTAIAAIELTLEQWLLMHDEKLSKYNAAQAVSRKHGLKCPRHLCFLCEYAGSLGDLAAWPDSPGSRMTCPHCPFFIVSGHCMEKSSPYAGWCHGRRTTHKMHTIICAILGMQAEWERLEANAGSSKEQ